MKLADEFEANLDSLETIDNFLVKCSVRGKLGRPIFFDLKLAIEEVFTNIVEYGLKGQQGAKILIQLQIDKKFVEVKISDTAKTFNPLTISDPDFDSPSEGRSQGGMGIYLVKQLMDIVEYCRDEGRNILTIKKHLY